MHQEQIKDLASCVAYLQRYEQLFGRLPLVIGVPEKAHQQIEEDFRMRNDGAPYAIHVKGVMLVSMPSVDIES